MPLDALILPLMVAHILAVNFDHCVWSLFSLLWIFIFPLDVRPHFSNFLISFDVLGLNECDKLFG